MSVSDGYLTNAITLLILKYRVSELGVYAMLVSVMV